MTRMAKVLLASFAALCAGCESKPAPTGNSSTPLTPPKTETKSITKPSAATETKIVVTPIDSDGLQAAVAKHAGKVVLVDCWATYCVPCMKDFHKTVELSHELAGDGLVVMSLAFDDLEDGAAPAKVRNFLKDKDAPFEHFISRLDLATPEAQTAFAISDGQLPHFKLYDRQGQLIKAFAVEDPDNADPNAPALHETVKAAVLEALK